MFVELGCGVIGFVAEHAHGWVRVAARRLTVSSARPGGLAPFSEVAPQILRKLRREKRLERAEQVYQRLVAKYKVEIRYKQLLGPGPGASGN